MESIVITDPQTGAQARVLAEFGFNCYSFLAPIEGQLVEVIDAEPDFGTEGGRASGNGIPLLFPFPNRIRGGRYRWGGKDYQISNLDADGNAIHGFVMDRPWRVIESGENFVSGQFQLSRDAAERRADWPADFIIEVRYEIQAAALSCRIRITNPSEMPLPWGLGTHPYFRMPLSGDSKLSDCLIQAPAEEAWELVNCLPTGKKTPVTENTDLREGRSLGAAPLDDVLTGLSGENGHMESVAMDARAGWQIAQRTAPIFRELVVYTPPHGRSVCLEPYTCVTDAINLEDPEQDGGWRTLPPSESFETWITIELERIYA